LFRAVDNVSTLSDFRVVKKFIAQSGLKGGKCNCQGLSGEDLILNVPVGTIVWNEGKTEVICDLSELNQTFIVAKGGRGGCGNAHFVTSVRQAPSFAEMGEPGEEVNIILELKLIADVGIIGVPSSGKSTLISRISEAKPKIADYPFTTLVPNLGVVDLVNFGGSKEESFVVIDVPGLIEGASEGKGLGDEFLRHTTRARFLVHLLDASRPDIVSDYQIINKELKLYSDELFKKEQIVVINKIDLIDKEFLDLLIESLETVNKKLKAKILAISAVSGDGIKNLVFALWKKIQQKPRLKKEEKIDEINEDHQIYRPHLERRPSLEITVIGDELENPEDFVEQKRSIRLTKKERMARMAKKKECKKEGKEFIEEKVIEEKTRKVKIFAVKHERFEQIVVMSNLNNEDALNRVYDVMKKFKIKRELLKMGAKANDKIIVSGRTIRFR
jgi:GTP-binding protein